MAYSDLSAYALMSPREAVGTYVREHGLAGLRGLGQAVSADVAQANITAGLAWVAANPLVESQMVTADEFNDPVTYQAQEANYQAAVQARALLVAALNAAQAKLNGDPASGSTSAEYQQAAATYQQYAQQAYQADMPSPFALNPLGALFGSGGLFDLSTTFGKVAVYGGAVLAAWVLVPRVMQGMRGSKSA
jgi:hypothetical protein